MLRVGCAAGFSGDRTDSAAPIVEALIAAGGPSFLIFETLAERTLAIAQLARRDDPAKGYEPLLDEYLRPVLKRCLENGVRIVSNFGAANPEAAARRIQELARELGIRSPRIATVAGDDVSGEKHRDVLTRALADVAARDRAASASHPSMSSSRLGEVTNGVPSAKIVSANAYIGAERIADALLADAQIVVCGRVADPSLTVGPALACYGWPRDDWNRIARATMAGHLLECGAQVTGGYYADAAHKVVPRLDSIGYPIAEIDEQGNCVISKPEGSGGLIDEHVVKEQLLYEVHDPAAYVTPDVVADLSEARVVQCGAHRVQLTGVQGCAQPSMLKVNVCYESGWLSESEISYAGVRAEARARLAMDVLRTRLSDLGQLRFDLIGVASIFGDDDNLWLAQHPVGEAKDVRLRVAVQTSDRISAERATRELFALHTAGPAGGGGGRTSVRPRIGTVSCFVAREHVPTRYEFIGGVARA